MQFHTAPRPFRPRRGLRPGGPALALGLALACFAPGPAARGQDAPDAAAAPERSAHPAANLTLRVAALQAQRPVRPVLVLAPDGRAYARAIAAWSPGEIFPVLIDDGSVRAREAAARFARALGPERVVALPPSDDADEPVPRDDLRRALADAWDAASHDELDETWAGLGWTPPGVVVTSADDPAWTAALALAAGRGQHLLFLAAPRGGGGGDTIATPALDAFDRTLTEALDELGRPWAGVGDEIDAVTLCTNTPGKIADLPSPPAPPDQQGPYALTDRIGRDGETGARWAWTGQVIGSEPIAAARAMSALFLQPRSAFLFDTYGPDMPSSYAARAATGVLDDAGVAYTLHRPPHARRDHWLGRGRRGLDAGIIHVNSSGHDSWFTVVGGRATSGDVPMLLEPAVVHFIHSFSARRLGRDTALATRWLDRGAAAYVGAVDEPFLQSFQPPATFFRRFVGGLPLSVAARIDARPPWKIQVLGDPLWTLSRPAPRLGAEPGTDDAEGGGGFARLVAGERVTDLSARMRDRLRARDVAGAIDDLVLLRRDDDAARLARAALDEHNRPADADADAAAGDESENAAEDEAGDRPVELADGAITAVARSAIHPVFRTGDEDLLAGLYLLLPAELAEDRFYQDLLWQALGPRVGAGDHEPLHVNLLRAHPRPESLVRDARTLLPAVSALYGRAAAERMVGRFMEMTRNERTRGRLSDLLTP